MEKAAAASSAGGDESAKNGGDAVNQKKEESEKFVSLLSKVRLNLYIHVYYIATIDIVACVIFTTF